MSVPSPAAGDKNSSCIAVFQASPVVYLRYLSEEEERRNRHPLQLAVGVYFAGKIHTYTPRRNNARHHTQIMPSATQSGGVLSPEQREESLWKGLEVGVHAQLLLKGDRGEKIDPDYGVAAHDLPSARAYGTSHVHTYVKQNKAVVRDGSFRFSVCWTAYLRGEIRSDCEAEQAGVGQSLALTLAPSMHIQCFVFPERKNLRRSLCPDQLNLFRKACERTRAARDRSLSDFPGRFEDNLSYLSEHHAVT